MKKTLLFVFTVLLSSCLLAQNRGIIKGVVFDAEKKQPMASASITLLRSADSSEAGSNLTNKDGSFELHNLAGGRYIIGVSTVGYREYIQNIFLKDSISVENIGNIYIQADTTAQVSVIVKAPAIVIKKDTVEFKASAFPTKVNANVEDLLKKLPGVEVDKEGNITSQGEEITKIYVDGKEFFSNDPKLATKNLTAELVESIQVFDDMSDQAKFTKVDDGSRTRTINIKLKKDRRKGYFGRANAAYGTKDRYSANLSANTFNDKRQISFVGGANNVNRLGFTYNDLVSNLGGFSGNRSGGGGGGGNRGGGGGGNRGGGGNIATSTPDGNTSSWNAGVNFRDQWGSKFQISGNYFISQSTTTNRSTSNRQNFLRTDSTTESNNLSYDRNSSLNNRFSLRAEYTIDSMNSILMTPTISWQNSSSYSYDSTTTFTKIPSKVYRSVDSRSDRNTDRSGFSIGNNLLYRHRFHKPGRTFTVGWTTGINSTDGNGYVNSPNTFFFSDSTISSQRNQNQRNYQETYSFNNTISASYTEQLSKFSILELNYAYSNNFSTSDRKTYDFSSQTQKYDSMNKPLTNYFENTFTSSRAGFNYRVKKEKYDYQLGGAVQVASLDNLSRRALTGKDSSMKQTYTNFFPTASFNYNLGIRRSLRFNYRGSTQAPTVTQLQDVVDQSNPTNFRVGNPNLKQQFNNNVQFSYNTFNVNTFMYFNINLSGSLISNNIVNSTDQLTKADLRRLGLPDTINTDYILLTQPVNLNGNYNVALSSTLGIPLKKVENGKRSPMNLNLTTSIRYSQGASLSYKVKNYTYNTSASERINFNYNIQDKLDLGTSARYTFNSTRYNTQKNRNLQYINHQYSVDATYTFLKNYNLNADFDYFINNGLAAGYNKGIPLMNLYISRYLFKKRNGEIRLSVNDLLNQNKSIRRDAPQDGTYIQDTYTQVLTRFFLVTFSYNLNKFGGRSQQGNNRGGNRNFINGGNGGNEGNGGNGGGNRGNNGGGNNTGNGGTGSNGVQ